MTKLIQTAVADSGLSPAEIARRAGISQGQLSRFLRDERTLTLLTAESVCKVVGLELRRVGKANTPKGKKTRKGGK